MRRLPRLQPLNEPIGGNDELSSLDATMHAAFDQLKEATEYRKSLMEMMAHDLRTPLAACQISIEMLDTIDGAKLSPMGQKQLHSIKVNVSRQLNLIKELLLLESLESGTMELDVQMADLAKVAQNAIDTVQALATAKDISLVNAITASGIEGVPCDPERISQVFTNYLSNAIKHKRKKIPSWLKQYYEGTVRCGDYVRKIMGHLAHRVGVHQRSVERLELRVQRNRRRGGQADGGTEQDAGPSTSNAGPHARGDTATGLVPAP